MGDHTGVEMQLDETDRKMASEDVRAASRIDPFLMSVLASRFEAIIREMANTVVKASRSAAVTNGRDMSCGLLTYDHRLICVEEAMPVHVMALDLTTRPITEHFDDIKPGDAFFNNCSYTGGTHHGDMTLCMPVFCDGEPLFWTLTRTHHADSGMPIATTMDPYAATIYQEGMQFPCVRIIEDYKEKADLIRMCRLKIRVSHVWYGDFRAQVGGCITGERRLKELVERYGKDTIKAFIEEWMDYGRRRVISSIKQLSKGTWEHETRHDPIAGVADEGIPVKAKVSVDPDAGTITVDLRDNIDCVPGGMNLSEATATGACRIGVFYNLDSTIPHNEGSAAQIKVLLRDNCVVGRPRYPVGTSVATTNVNDRLINAVSGCFAKMGKPHGMAEGGTELCAGEAMVSGRDSRKGTEHEYVNLLCLAFAGGPGLHGHDGWLTWEAPNGGGVMAIDSIEIDESLYPILVEARHVARDTLGCGEWDGAPGIALVYRPLDDPVSLIFVSDGDYFPAKGLRGGRAAAPATTWKRHGNKEREKLPSSYDGVLNSGEAIELTTCGGGGYGDPSLRDPHRVASAVNRQWISKEKADEIYSVKLKLSENGIDYFVDAQATEQLRSGGGRVEP